MGACGAANVVNLHEYLISLGQVADRAAVVLTRSARELASPRSIRAVTGSTVYTDEDHHGLAVPHMELALWADLIVVVPATANILGKTAHGIADDLLSSIILAYAAPVIFVPSMNPAMWMNPAVRRNVELLKEDGHRFLFSDTTRPSLETATGEWIMSELGLNPEELVKKVSTEAESLEFLKQTAE
ncbi:flavoprotein [Streptosporangium sp. NPDC000396]|uniref:flavoprotein n=1 Tax=Streptosporangium sp. NPDC000396 TaxID=3366185 RepID=UPI0036AB9720